MSGGLASSAARQLAVPESVSRSRPESATRMPVRQPPAALGGRRSQVPSTRERMQASFVAGPRAASREAIRMVGPVEAAPVARAPAATPAAEALTTRKRIVNRALAAPKVAPPTDVPASAVAVEDFAEMRDRRRPQRSDVALTPARPTAFAPVIDLASRPQVAMPGARGIAGRGDVVASAAPARAGPEAGPAGITATFSPTRKLDPEATGAPARAGPESSEAGSASLTAGPDAASAASSQGAAALQSETAGAQAPTAAPVVLPVVIQELWLDDSPGASAPSIGDVRRHGQQTLSVRSGPRVWWTEPEHVMPFAAGKMLWDTVGELIPGRGGVEDDQQTTIMIYEPAARQKANGYDGPVIASFTSQCIAGLQPVVWRLRRFREAEGRVGVDSQARRDFTGVFGRVLARMAQMSRSAVAATQAAVYDEHASADASGQTNGTRRAEPAPLPTNAQIAAAAEEQCDDVIDLARATVERGERR